MKYSHATFELSEMLHFTLVSEMENEQCNVFILVFFILVLNSNTEPNIKDSERFGENLISVVTNAK